MKNILQCEQDNKTVHLLLPTIKMEIQETIHVTRSMYMFKTSTP